MPGLISSKIFLLHRGKFWFSCTKRKSFVMNRKKYFVLAALLFAMMNSFAQWELAAGVGDALPITGYGEVLKKGWLLNAEAKRRLGKGNFALGTESHFVRLQRDKNSSDAFGNARMTIVPLVFTGEYETVLINNKWKPFVSGGLGITVFNLNYDSGPFQHNAYTNVSFTMSPKFGLRYALAENLIPFIQSSLILIADGPPVGFPKGEKLTG